MPRSKMIPTILLACLALTGCAAAGSATGDIELLEYEKCLSAEEAQFLAVAQASSKEDLGTFFREQKLEGLLVENFIEACKKFRPK